MRRTIFLIAAGAAAAIATPALAQSTDDSSFSGPWIAGVGGYDINKHGSSQNDTVNDPQNKSANGWVYGAAVGYDADLGGVVIGAEGEITDSTADSDYDNNYVNYGLGSVDAGRDLYVGARIGFKATPSTLIYAKGGYTNARFNFVGTNGTTDTDEHIDTDGWRLGAGVQQKFGSNTFVKLEYRYSNYKKGEIDFEDPNVPDSSRFNIDTDRHQIVAGVGLQF